MNRFRLWLISTAAIAAVLLGAPIYYGCNKGKPPDSTTTTPVPVPQPPSSATVWSYSIVKSYPHDADAFTEGLQYIDGVFYEGTGLNDSSYLRKVDPATGNVLQSTKLATQYFGEGVVALGNRIYQLTWQNNTCFVYDRPTFRAIDTFAYGGEGWGLTTDGKEIIMSDGTNSIRFVDPATFKINRNIVVYDDNRPLYYLNELEWVNGVIYANIWKTDSIARIDPASGKLLGYIDLHGLLAAGGGESGREDVLNGIAYDAAADRLFVTGKHWTKIFEIKPAGPGAATRPSAAAAGNDTSKPSLQ